MDEKYESLITENKSLKERLENAKLAYRTRVAEITEMEAKISELTAERQKLTEELDTLKAIRPIIADKDAYGTLKKGLRAIADVASVLSSSIIHNEE